MSEADLELLYKEGEPQGKKGDEEWKVVGYDSKGEIDFMVSNYGRCTTKGKGSNKPHFGYFEKDRKHGRVRYHGEWVNVLKKCKESFPKEKWDFVDPFWDKQGSPRANSVPNK